MNKFEEVSTVGHQMSLSGVGGVQFTERGVGVGGLCTVPERARGRCFSVSTTCECKMFK